MNIVVFYQYFGTPNGSWSTRVYEFTKRWVDAGHSVTVVTAPYDKSDIVAKGFITKTEVAGINLVIINSGDSNRFSKIKRMFRALRFSIVSMWYALTLKYDVCIASSGPMTIGFPMLAAKLIRRKATIFEVRDLWPAGAIELGIIKSNWQIKTALFLERTFYKNADVVVTASVGQTQNISRRFPNVSVETIPNASDIELFGTRATGELPIWAREKKLFTHIGSLGLIHNIDYWMDVARALKKLNHIKDILLVFIGDGVDRDRLEQAKKNEGLENIVFLGLKPKSELPLWLQNSCATLFATLNNPAQDSCSPNKIFDSFAASTPIFQTSNGWIKSLVDNSNCGVNVDLNDPNSAAMKMIEYSERPELLRIMGENSLALALNDFNRDKLAVKYMRIMKGITCG